MMFTLIGTALGCMLCMAVLWHFAWKAHRVDVIDVGWSLAIAGAAVTYASTLFEPTLRIALVTACPALWAARLSIHLISRIRKTPEDPRYAIYRTQWGSKAKYNFLGLFILQGFISFILSLAILAAQSPASAALQNVDYVALTIFCLAFYLESLADKQLRDWKYNPKTKHHLCRTGLWNYSRHPNYFFEWLKWWSYVVFAIGGNLWWLSLIGVATMYYLLVYVTGIPPSEERSLKNRGEEFKKYQKEVNAFFPALPREKNG